MAWVRAGVATGADDMWARGADVLKTRKRHRARAGVQTRDVPDARDAADHWARPRLCLDLARVEEEVNAERFLNLKQKFRLSELTTGNGGVAVRFHAPATRWRGEKGQETAVLTEGEGGRRSWLGEVPRRRGDDDGGSGRLRWSTAVSDACAAPRRSPA